MVTPEDCTANGLGLDELFRAAGLRAVDAAPIPGVRITSLTDDSRTVESGACFIAVHGVGVDGHDYLKAAIHRGARVAIADRDVAATAGAATIIRVPDTRVALARLAAAYYGLRASEHPRMQLIGITGTNGKTTVAWMLRSILNATGSAAALLGTIEWDVVSRKTPARLTTPGPLELCRNLSLARDAGAKFAVLEVSSHALDQRRCDGLSFSAGVFTNLSGDHLDYHASMDAYAAAKRRLFDLLTPDGVSVVNTDDPIGRSWFGELTAAGRRTVTYGLNADDAQMTARIERSDRTGSAVVIRGSAFEMPVRLALIGRHNVENALAAAATAWALGTPPDVIRTGLERLRGVRGRLERVGPVGGPFAVLVDYAHTDAALENVLSAIRRVTGGRVICVFGCGGDRDRTKRPRMAAVAQRHADLAIVTSDNPRRENPLSIIDEIVAGFRSPRPGSMIVEPDRRTAIHRALDEAQPGDTVLIAGKGHETYQLVGDEILDFDDAAEARAYLRSQFSVRTAV